MTKPAITVLGNLALVEMEGANVTEKGGIIVSATVAANSASKDHAHIMALGDGDKIGQKLKDAYFNESRIFINRNFIGAPVIIDGKNYRMVSVGDILAILD